MSESAISGSERAEAAAREPTPRKPIARRLAWLVVIAVLAGWAAAQPNPPPEPVGWTGWTGV
jgi:hypothetical protein